MRISDAWRVSTPAPLQKAIEHIRKTFDDDLWSATQSEDDCHQAITQANRTSPEPEIFQKHWNALAKSIHQLVEGAFTLLLAIASKNNLEKPVEWATSQVRLMLEDEMLVEDIQVLPRGATRLRRWIVTACDGVDLHSPPSTDKIAIETWLFYRDWQSPAWLHMKPSVVLPIILIALGSGIASIFPKALLPTIPSACGLLSGRGYRNLQG